MNFSTIIKENDEGELYIDLPQELMEALDWDENTDLVWCVSEDGKITLRKQNDNSNEA